MKFSKITLAVILAASSLSAHAYFNLNTQATFYNDSEFKNSNLEVSKNIYTLSASNQYFTAIYKHTDYDFSNGYDYIDSTEHIYLDGRLDGNFYSSLGYFSGLGLSMGFEDDFDISKNYGLMARAGLSYNFTQDVQGFLGVFAQHNRVEDTFLPIIGIKIGNESDRGWSGALAYPYTKLTYRFNPMFAVDGTLITVKDLTHLSDNSKIQKEGFIFEESYALGIKATLTPIKALNLSAGINYMFDSEYTIYNKDENEIASYETDSSLGFNLGLSYTF